MFQLIQNWFNRRVIRRSTITPSQWDEAFTSLPLLRGISAEDKRTLQELAILFLHHKAFEGAHGLEVTDRMKLIIVLQACLPILRLGWGCYDQWMTVIVYPSGFAPKRVVRDEYGVEHQVQDHLSGEAWYRGPVVLSWDDTEHAGIIDGHNLVIHEFAHKLDMQNGDANGYPPLHKGMDSQAWADAFTAGHKDLKHLCSIGKNTGIDCYAASSPAEYFAVLSEVFFERPGIIKQHSAAVYQQLRLYYRQDPLSRL
jgi:Mlc titration factor MtfA (ptsG expression regulator)